MCETSVEFPDMEILDHYAFQLLHLDYTTNSFFFCYDAVLSEGEQTGRWNQ